MKSKPANIFYWLILIFVHSLLYSCAEIELTGTESGPRITIRHVR
jgi:hypothetical protein